MQINKQLATPNKCPCCSGKTFAACCQPLLIGEQAPDTAEQLMRSRYSAFCTHNVDYLIKTLAPAKRQPNEREQLETSIRSTLWLGLKVLKTKQQKTTSEVEFVGFYQSTEGVKQLHERSDFIFTDQWYYTEGTHLPPIKLGRNDTCYCGSGCKYKKCCG